MTPFLLTASCFPEASRNRGIPRGLDSGSVQAYLQILLPVGIKQKKNPTKTLMREKGDRGQTELRMN